MDSFQAKNLGFTLQFEHELIGVVQPKQWKRVVLGSLYGDWGVWDKEQHKQLYTACIA